MTVLYGSFSVDIYCKSPVVSQNALFPENYFTLSVQELFYFRKGRGVQFSRVCALNVTFVCQFTNLSVREFSELFRRRCRRDRVNYAVVSDRRLR